MIDEEDKEEEKKEKNPKNVVAKVNYSQILKNFKQNLQQRLDRALVMPTHENVKAYMEMQEVMMERAELFGKRWIEVLYQTPALDYTVTHPVNQVGIFAAAHRDKKWVEHQIKALAGSHGLFFFFKGECPYCHAFAPIVKSFSQKYGWKVLAISMDGSTLSDFPGSIRDNGAAERLGVTVYPTLLAVNPRTESIIPLSYGLSSHDQIEQRLKTLLHGDPP